MTKQKFKIPADVDFSDEWFAEARKQSPSTQQKFLLKLIVEYKHNNQSKISAMAAAALSAAFAFNKSSQGHLTQEEGNRALSELVFAWMRTPNLCGMNMYNYADMIHPANREAFANVIPRSNFTALQELAQKQIDDADNALHVEYPEQLAQYERELAAFIEKHPDYNERKDYYTHAKDRPGTQWDEIAADQQRKLDGFKYAPVKPKEPEISQELYDHWKSIVAGEAPFGFTILEPPPAAEPELKVVKDEEETEAANGSN